MRNLILFALLLAAVAGCTSKAKEIQRVMDSPIAVESHFEDGTDISQFSTWNWIPSTSVGHDPRSGDAQTTKLILEAFGGELFSKGYKQVGSGYNLIANFYLAQEHIDKAFINEYYGGNYPEYKADMTGKKDDNLTWEEGTLIFFLFDSSNGQLIYQSSAQAEITEGASMDQRTTRIKKAAKMMLTKLPSSSGARP